jgi:hypothetical protein
MAERAESPQVDNRVVIFIALGILLFVIIFVFVLSLLFPELIHRPPPVVARLPAPSVLADERMQRITLERAQLDRLTGKSGTMPIERAMAAIAAKGTAAYTPLEGAGP